MSQNDGDDDIEHDDDTAEETDLDNDVVGRDSNFCFRHLADGGLLVLPGAQVLKMIKIR